MICGPKELVLLLALWMIMAWRSILAHKVLARMILVHKRISCSLVQQLIDSVLGKFLDSLRSTFSVCGYVVEIAGKIS